MKIELSSLQDLFFNISNIFVVRQISQEKTQTDMSVRPRETSALMFFLSGTAVCYQEGEAPLFVPQGAVVYMPKGSRYFWDSSPAQENGLQERILFEFDLSLAKISRTSTTKRAVSTFVTNEEITFSEKVCLLTGDFAPIYNGLFEKLLKDFQKEPLSPLKLYCTAYEIFNTLCHDIRHKYRKKGNTEIIGDGIRYIESYREGEISVSKAADLCNVSIGYFERLFKEYSGTSPQEYINSRKIYIIKTLILENRLTLTEIAEKFSFCDTGYLCRWFKKKTGLTPKEYRKLYEHKSNDIIDSQDF